MRSIPVEWTLFGNGTWDYDTNQQNVYNFWVEGAERARPFEGVYTVGMRGNGDCALHPIVSKRSCLLSVPHGANVYMEMCSGAWCRHKCGATRTDCFGPARDLPECVWQRNRRDDNPTSLVSLYVFHCTFFLEQRSPDLLDAVGQTRRCKGIMRVE